MSTTDLVARLRARADDPFDGKTGSVSLDPIKELLREAADRLDSFSVDAALREADLLARAEAAEAESARLTQALAWQDELTKEWSAKAEKAEARAARYEALLRDWLKAYDDCGPDNGPSLCEHECAERARTALSPTPPQTETP